MNDKDRILTTIIDELASSRLLGRQADGLADHGIIADHNGFVRAQFLSDYLIRPKPGDIVRCLTSRDHPWKISRFVEDHGGASGGHYLLREIGSQRHDDEGRKEKEPTMQWNEDDERTLTWLYVGVLIITDVVAPLALFAILAYLALRR